MSRAKGISSSGSAPAAALALALALAASGCHLVFPYEQSSSTGGDGLTDSGGDLTATGDGRTKKANGSKCSQWTECTSSFCSQGRCCEKACIGLCRSCALPGKEGTCSPLEAGTACGTTTCKDAVLQTTACNGKGSCEDTTQSCNGYVCASASPGSCKKSCSSETDCADGFYCKGGVCAGSLALGQPCGTNSAACASGHCADGVCCTTGCTESCMACDLAQKVGTCSYIPKGEDPGSECPGDIECGGACNGSGGCDTPKAEGTSCKASQCSSSDTMLLYQCDANHACTGSSKACTPFKCDSGTAACLIYCTSHDDCLSSSVCDRTFADVSGSGKCVSTSDVYTHATTSGSLQQGVTKAQLASASVLRLESGTYDGDLIFSGGKQLLIVGVGTVTISSSGGTAVSVSASGSGLSLQGVMLTTTGSSVVPLASCGAATFVSSTPTSLSLYESTVKGGLGLGISSTNCKLVLRRSMVQYNKGGGIQVTGGTYTIVNSLISGNGTTSSLIGGAYLYPSASTSPVPILAHSTVASNYTSGTQDGDVQCGFASLKIESSILWGNTSTGRSSGGCPCDFSYSVIQNTSSMCNKNGNNLTQDPDWNSTTYKLNSTSLCIDKGSPTITYSKIDLANAIRVQGSFVDMGAYEAM